MPISPENRKRYPFNWRAISYRIRFGRALGACECAGECGVVHAHRRCNIGHGSRTSNGARVMLTVAHLDHTPENCDDANLKAMCQRCHLRYDKDHHQANAARTRKKMAARG